MKIKEFSIRRYGPLPDTGRITVGNFSLFFGKNEDGKTLTIDGLVKMLLRTGRRLFERINRVNEEPEGYLIVEDAEGRELKLPEKGDLTDITDLTPEECRNIFIIRNSDLSIALESGFYRNVTDRLVGLRTGEISQIKGQLQELGKLTKADSTASLRDWAGEKLKTGIRRAHSLIEKIKALDEKIRAENFDRFEDEFLKIREEASEVSRRIEAFENARKREQYEKCNSAYEALTSARKNLEELEVYIREDEQLWAGYEKDIKNSTEDIQKLQNVADTEKGELRQKVKELEVDKLALQALAERKKRLDDEIKLEIKNYEMKSGELALKETKGRFFAVAAIISVVLLSILAFGIILRPSLLSYALFVCFLILTGVFATLRFSLIREKAWLAGVFERIKLSVSRFELGAESIGGILSNIQKFDEEYSKRQMELEQLKTEVSLLERETKNLEETQIPSIEEKNTKAKGKIDEVISKTGVRTLQEYREKLALKLGYERSAETQLGILQSHFGSAGETSEENLSHWLEDISALKEFEDKAKDIAYDEKTASQLKSEHEMLLTSQKELEGRMADLFDQLREVEKEANEILRLEDDYLYCNTSVDMNAIRDKLLECIAKIEVEKDDALEAIRIFEELEGEEEEKISALFGKDSPISKHFCKITGGIYEEVEFVLDDVRKVQVRLQDGSILAADKLSGGAYDQLYLSIRLALGEKLLKGGNGFFIMDDPFVKADLGRLQKQLDILKSISESGWQIMYFTAKDEVKDVLQQDIQSGRIRYVELQGTFPQ